MGRAPRRAAGTPVSAARCASETRAAPSGRHVPPRCTSPHAPTSGRTRQARVDFSGPLEKQSLGPLGKERLAQSMALESGGWRSAVFPFEPTLSQEFITRNLARATASCIAAGWSQLATSAAGSPAPSVSGRVTPMTAGLLRAARPAGDAMSSRVHFRMA